MLPSHDRVPASRTAPQFPETVWFKFKIGQSARGIDVSSDDPFALPYQSLPRKSLTLEHGQRAVE